MKCTGLNCPMQHGYDVENCKLTDCKYRTMPKTNYDRIKNMSVEEMADFIADIYADNEHAEIRVNGEWLDSEDIEQWLESEASENDG